MDNTKDCKVYFSTLIQRMHRKNKDYSHLDKPLYSVGDLVTFIYKRKKVDRYYDLKENKFCFLETVTINPQDEKTTLISGFFKSSRDNFRPNVLDKKTGQERPNPKNKGESDVDKTHFVIKIDKINQEVYLFLEYNFHGINTNNIIDYLSHFNSILLKERNEPKNYTIKHLIIPKNNFLTELESLSRTRIAEIYFNKKLLGSEALNLSDRYFSLIQDVEAV